MHLNKPLKHSQQGQGMVEYAIMLILLITLVIGGIELAGATLASGKASDAAKAAVNDFATVNQKRLNAQANQQKYLQQISNLVFEVTNSTVVATNDEGVISGPVTTPIYDNYVLFLDSISNTAIANSDPDLLNAFLTAFFGETTDELYFFNYYNKDTPTNPDDDADAEGVTGDLVEIINSIDGIMDADNDGDVDGDDADGDISAEELIYAVQQGKIKQKILNLAPTDAEDTDAGVADTNDRIVRYKALLLFEELELAILPLDPRIGLSQSIPLLGDHDPDTNTELTRPSCNVEVGDIEYDYGFPTDTDGNIVRNLAFTITVDGVDSPVDADFPAVYLFNPLPIQLDSCVGNDVNRDNQSLISVLVGGYGKEGDAEYEPGLPKLNTSFHGQYSHVCLDGANAYTRCGTANAAEEILKPPGKTCFSDTASDTVDSCTVDEPPPDTSGYYFWGQVNDAGNGQFAWEDEEGVAFRPTLQLICNGGSADDEDDLSNISNDECYDDPDDEDAAANLKTIRVNVRYRHVFESFLTFGMLELAEADLAQYFYDPSNLRSPAVSVGTGIAGSELGPKASGKNPTVKQFKDFRGCYEINVETNQVGSCN